MPEVMPEQLKQFLAQYFDSIELLQVLLLLQQSPSRIWTVPEITRALASADSSVEKRFGDLYSRGVIDRHPGGVGHQFLPKTEDLRQLICLLQEFYLVRPCSVMEAIFSKPRNTLESFADAFKLGKKE